MIYTLADKYCLDYYINFSNTCIPFPFYLFVILYRFRVEYRQEDLLMGHLFYSF